MNEETKHKALLIQKITFTVYCAICGAVLIIFSILGYSAERVSLGILFLLACVFHVYEFHHNFNNKLAASIYGALALAGIILGLGCLFDTTLELWLVCLIFGIMDLTSGALEILTNALILKKPVNSKANATEYIISIADIIFGILLIIKLEQGLLVHVLYLAVVFLVNAAVAILEIAAKVDND